MTTNEIFEQAKVFASALSLVGSRFDSGDGIDYANKEEERLDEMIAALTKERDALAHDLVIERARKTIIEQDRDALKDAARRALGVMDDLRGIGMSNVECLNVIRAIAALKAVL